MTAARNVTRQRLWGVIVAAAAMLAAPAAADAATVTVEAGPDGRALQKQFQSVFADANVFFNRAVTIHPGDRVSWQLNGLHTATFSPGKDKLPFVIPDPANPVSGFLDAAGSPFWFNGQPRVIANPLAVTPQGPRTFRRNALVSSGLPPIQGKPKPYVVRFNRKGTFGYYCIVHPEMTGSVRVVGRKRAVLTPAQNRKAARRAMTAALARAKQRASGPDQASLGDVIQAGNDDRLGTAIFKYFPANKTVKAGSTVTMRMSPDSTEVHTFSFGPTNGKDQYLDQVGASLFTPQPGPGGQVTVVLEPRTFYPSEPPPAGVPAVTSTLHGNGFLNTGPLDLEAASPLPSSTQVRFPEVGTFKYICLIHPFMNGTVTVTP